MDQAYYNEALRLSAKSVVTAGLIFLACLLFGSPLWKAGIVAIVILVTHRADIGRKYAELLAFIAAAVALAWWADILPSYTAVLETISSLK
jgi:hypothetical protein